MKEETIFIGYAYLGCNENFYEVFDTEEEVIASAKKAYEDEDIDSLGENEDGSIPNVIRILKVYEINKENLIHNALIEALEYMNAQYDDFESGIDDGSILAKKELFEKVIPIMSENIDFGGITQKGYWMYEYDLVEDKIVE